MPSFYLLAPGCGPRTHPGSLQAKTGLNLRRDVIAQTGAEPLSRTAFKQRVNVGGGLLVSRQIPSLTLHWASLSFPIAQRRVPWLYFAYG